MPLVFVHGVNVRKDEEGRYQQAESRRDAFFKEFVLAPIAADSACLVVKNPYWGNDAATFPWVQAALPEAEYESFGREEALETDEVLPAVALSGLPPLDDATADIILPWLARRSFEAAVDLLLITASDPAVEVKEPGQLARLAKQAGAYAFTHKDAAPAWLDQVTTNEQFVDRLMQELEAAQEEASGEEEQWEGFGFLSDVWETARDAAQRIHRSARRVARSQFRKRIRDPLHETFARFLGDTLVYIKSRDEKRADAPIIKLILADLAAADTVRQATGDPLIVVAHSMGGNILYDILTHFRPDLKVDFFVTVGSQVAVFEELKLFKASDTSIPRDQVPKVAKPPNVDTWLNVFDHSDPLGFATSKVFEKVTDFEFDTGGLLFGAHSAYFSKPSFHHRLGLRVRGKDS